MAVIPLSVRRSMYDEHSPEAEIALVTITHPDLDAPLRFSSDPTERLSSDPLRYGTTSRKQVFDFLPMSTIIPDDRKSSPPRTSLVLENIDADLAAISRSFVDPPSVDVELVMVSDPEFLVQAYRGLRIVRSSYDEQSVTFDLAREPYTSEPFGGRQTKDKFPGLHGLTSA